MTFSLKYQSQLRRTRPELYSQIEKTLMNSVIACNGKIKRVCHCIIAYFDEQTIGFWIDILTVIETIQKILNLSKAQLYGHVCLFSSCHDYSKISEFLFSIPTIRIKTGIWCSPQISTMLFRLVFFNSPYYLPNKPDEGDDKNNCFLEISSTIADKKHEKISPLRKKISKELAMCVKSGAVLNGENFSGKRDCLQWFCRSINEDFEPLTIHFGSWGRGLSCFADALSPNLRKCFFESGVEIPSELETLYTMLFSERLKWECSEFSLKKGKRFFELLTDLYMTVTRIQKYKPFLVLENIQAAPSEITEIILEIYKKKLCPNGLVMFATSTKTEILAPWQEIFSVNIDCAAENILSYNSLNINTSLLEIAYAIELFRQYFPPYIIVTLLEEEGKNTYALTRALTELFQSGVIRSIDDPEPEVAGFLENAREAIGQRVFFIQTMIKNRLLAWVSAGKIKPCFNLLEILYDLKFTASPLLVLEAIRNDINSGTYHAIEQSIEDETFENVCGTENAQAMLYIFRAFKALNYGNEKEIHETFKMPQTSNVFTDIYRAQILMVNAIYKVGINDARTALEEIKEALLIYQNNRTKTGVSQVYRLFSLVHFYNREINDAMDYINFAIEETERKKDYNEMAIISYYAATANFIFGNISKAQRLIVQAEKSAIFSGRKEWALRSKFLCGRFYFEIGLYEEAYKVFEDLRGEWDKDKDVKKYHFITNWMNRAKLYMKICDEENTHTKGNFKDIVFLEGDGTIFKIEAAYLTGNYELTINLANKVLSSPLETNFQFLEQPDWTSGFAQCEYLLYSKKDYWNRMISVWRSLAICKCDKVKTTEAVHTMQQITRDERMADIDPSAAFYFFANYRVFNETNSNEVDKNTAISMAFKRLQLRANKIDDIETRRTYLNSNYWNKILFSTAKKYKLI
jgi:tetratricopeptide (TPR) repeat protein